MLINIVVLILAYLFVKILLSCLIFRSNLYFDLPFLSFISFRDHICLVLLLFDLFYGFIVGVHGCILGLFCFFMCFSSSRFIISFVGFLYVILIMLNLGMNFGLNLHIYF